jgi:transposase
MVRDEDLARRLVVRRGTNGNCTYDESAKRELIELGQSGVASVAKVALTYGVNPNQLHNWIALYRRARAGSPLVRLREAPENRSSPFIAVVSAPIISAPQEIKLNITLVNGVQTDLYGLSRDDILNLLPMLASLPCSASTRR